MRSSFRIIPVFFAILRCACLNAQEVRFPPTTTLAAITAPLHDEIPAEPPAPIVKPDFRVEGERSKQVYAVEPPPLPGLPPVEGVITLTVQSVADPGLPDPPPPIPVVMPAGAETHGNFTEAVEKHRQTRFAFVSATVYDRLRTRFTCYSNGGPDGTVTAWTNIDFNHMAGLGTFQASRADGEVRDYFFLMGIGNEDTERMRKLPNREDIAPEVPNIPYLPDGAPAFVIETENPHPDTVALIEDLHALYRTEGKRMAEDAAAREKAYEEKKVRYLANPPKPKDVTVRFWKREKPAANPEGVRP